MYEPTKRVLDVSVAICLGALASPLIALGAAAVWLEDGQSPFYLSRRVGRGGREFRMVKLRTMRSPASSNCTGVEASANLPRLRVTRVGVLLRRTKLDELPQLWNVLVGEMSLVGPRPHVPAERHIVDDPVILSVRPGITDLSSLVFIDLNEVALREAEVSSGVLTRVVPWKRMLARLYVERRSLWLDTVIVGLTGWALISRQSAYSRIQRLLVALGVKDVEAERFFESWMRTLRSSDSTLLFPAPPVEIGK